MKNLTDLDAIHTIDPQNTLGSTEMLVEQLQAAWSEVFALHIAPVKDVKTIVFCGMGASIYGALVLRALVGPSLTYPCEVISDYHLPSYVDASSLVVLTSYSGTTEEVLSCANEAMKKQAKMLVLTKGGNLSEFAKANSIPSYIFNGKLNPAGIPRLGAGYTILGLIGLLIKAGIVDINPEEIGQSITHLQSRVEFIKQQAMKDAHSLVGKIPVVFAAEHLAGNAQILRNQFNETSKTFSSFYLVPDLNHHLMEGLQFPKPSHLYFIILNSMHYSNKIAKRMELTKEVVQKNNQEVFEFKPETESIYTDFLVTLTYGSYLSLYLGLLYDQNPAINPWVDYFKEQLKS